MLTTPTLTTYGYAQSVTNPTVLGIPQKVDCCSDGQQINFNGNNAQSHIDQITTLHPIPKELNPAHIFTQLSFFQHQCLYTPSSYIHLDLTRCQFPQGFPTTLLQDNPHSLL